jgi:hypothetical protein
MALSVFFTLCCSYAHGLPNEPYWDVTVGDPGVTHPYFTWSIDALQVYDDGNGEMLYAGGNFDDFAGLPGTSLIACWDRDSNTWSGVGGGLDDSGFVQAIATFDAGSGAELIVGGVFSETNSGVPDTTHIAKWNGSQWSSLGTGLVGDLVGAMTTWDGVVGNRLYVGGRFPTAGGVTVNGIAAWDGSQWHSTGDGITGSFHPYVGTMLVWDDGSGEKLYVGGRFDIMNGLNTPLIARWDGEAWEQVGAGLINDNILFGIESMAVYDDGSGPALFVGGYEFHAPGQPLGNVSKWDGQQWTTVGPRYDGRCTSLCVFDDGSGPGLYRTGNAFWELGYFAKLVNGDWEMVGGGITKSPYENPWPSTSDLLVWDDALYVCGFFNRAGGFQGVGGEACGDIAAWTRSLALSCDVYTISARTGGTVNFNLQAGADQANRNYLILGGTSGTDPGTVLPGGLVTLPLNWDWFTDLALSLVNTGLFSNFMGQLDGDGNATAQLNTPPLPAIAVGLNMYYAFCCNNLFDYVSNPVEIEIVD